MWSFEAGAGLRFKYCAVENLYHYLNRISNYKTVIVRSVVLIQFVQVLLSFS